jgi:nucleoid DNA-binding protein
VLKNVGTLAVYERAPRLYRNPRTGSTIDPRPVRAVRFQSSRNLREQLKETD